MKSSVTTKQGDSGMTRTLASETVAKTHPVIECTGHVDALRAWTASLRLEIVEDGPEPNAEVADFLFWLLHVYFLLGATVSDPRNAKPQFHKGAIGEAHLARLEAMQEKLESQVELPQAFIVSATNRVAAQADLTATETRALERSLVKLAETIPEFDSRPCLAFINRLSDFFYVLARYLEQGKHLPVDYKTLDTQGAQE